MTFLESSACLKGTLNCIFICPYDWWPPSLLLNIIKEGALMSYSAGDSSWDTFMFSFTPSICMV